MLDVSLDFEYASAKKRTRIKTGHRDWIKFQSLRNFCNQQNKKEVPPKMKNRETPRFLYMSALLEYFNPF